MAIAALASFAIARASDPNPVAERVSASPFRESLTASAAGVSAAVSNRREIPAGMVLIPAGIYTPLIRTKDEPAEIPVSPFFLDERPVTNGEFLAFVRAHPQWRRSRVSPLFADTGYLADWAGDLELGRDAPADAPVVRVSWFSARAFARAQGKRLPTTAEWERAAAAGFSSPEGANEPGFNATILAWFAQPTPTPLPAVGSTRPNYFGARDLFGLVWEWVDDFNTAMTTGESRGDTGLERTLFCGAGAAGARDLTNYPAYMRAGFRSSVRANYAVPNLGFRCAANADAQPNVGASLDDARAPTSSTPTPLISP